MPKVPEATFDNITKPGDKFQSFKPNAAMQDVLRQDFLKAGFVFGADGKIDLAASAKIMRGRK